MSILFSGQQLTTFFMLHEIIILFISFLKIDKHFCFCITFIDRKYLEAILT